MFDILKEILISEKEFTKTNYERLTKHSCVYKKSFIDSDGNMYLTVDTLIEISNTTTDSTHFLMMKILNKRELQEIALNHSSNINFKDFVKIYKKCTTERYSFLVNDTTLLSNDLLWFRKNHLK